MIIMISSSNSIIYSIRVIAIIKGRPHAGRRADGRQTIGEMFWKPYFRDAPRVFVEMFQGPPVRGPFVIGLYYASLISLNHVAKCAGEKTRRSLGDRWAERGPKDKNT